MTSTDIILSIFTGIVALALLLQGFALLALYRRMRDLSTRLEDMSAKLTKQIDTLGEQAKAFLVLAKSTAEKVHAVQENVTAISDVVHRRVLQVDAFIAEATDAARLQIARLQDVLDTTSSRIEETIDTVQTAVVAPVTEIQAIIRGIRTGFDVLLGWRRRATERSHEDEEMFI